MDVSIIIVNWNSVAYLRQCLSSLYRGSTDITFEVIVVDNASFDGCKEMLDQDFPLVRFIQNEKNLGFAKANNVAVSTTEGRNILFLNPDTEIESAALVSMCYWLDTLPNAGIVGAKLLNSDGSVQTSSIRVFPTILNQLLDIDALRKMFPRAGIWGTAPLLVKENDPAEVDAVSGASLMIKRSVFKSVGMFSPEYFMYSEDIDLCFKVKREGWKNYFDPMAVIIHHGGTSSKQSAVNAFSSVMELESRLRFFHKTRSRWYCQLYRMSMCVASLMRIGFAMLIWPLYGFLGKKSSIKNVIVKWTACLRWSLGKENWVNIN